MNPTNLVDKNQGDGCIGVVCINKKEHEGTFQYEGNVLYFYWSGSYMGL